jgi:putative heme-binding domain-containing protein
MPGSPTRAVSIVAVTLSLGASLLAGQRPQAPPQKNPLEGEPAAIKAGMGIFRARCADCHGVDAKGVRGPDISRVWAEGRSDNGLFQTLRNGVPNTEMPSVGTRTSDIEVWQILAYVRTLAAPGPADPPRGNAQNGERVFRVNCASCHQVNGKGGRLGPDLSRIGAARAREAIAARIVGATEGSRPGYEPVTVTPPDGQPIQGVKKNEDLFSVQIMDSRERIQGYEKEKMQAVVDGKKSAMPVFGPDRLSQSDLDDVVRYLQGLRGFDPAVKQ